MGQYLIYQNILNTTDRERALYLAIRETVYNDLFAEPIAQLLLTNKQVKLIVFDPEKEELSQWID